MRYGSKQALVDDIRTAYASLCAVIDAIPRRSLRVPGVWGDAWTVSDLVAHLGEWQRMFLRWYEEGLTDVTPELPAAGYKWSELPKLNRAIWERHRSQPFQAVWADFCDGHRRILDVVESLPAGQLLEPGQFGWTGRNSLAAYVGPNSASHYRFALKVLKRWRKLAPASAGARPHQRSRLSRARRESTKPAGSRTRPRR